MKIFRHFIIVFVTTFIANSIYASPIYSIDSTQSYVSAYVPNWTAYNFTPYYVSGPGAPTPPPTIVWDLAWTLENFQLSGNFQGTTEISPWNSAWAHLTITNENLQSQLPSYVQGPFLPGQITYSVLGNNVVQINNCGTSDPFYPPSSGSCLSSNVPSLSGTFDGETLALAGSSGAVTPFGSITFVGNGTVQQIVDPGPPPLLDASQYPTQWGNYQIVANVIPEPGTLPLVLIGCMLIGSLVVKQRAAKYRIPTLFFQ